MLSNGLTEFQQTSVRLTLNNSLNLNLRGGGALQKQVQLVKYLLQGMMYKRIITLLSSLKNWKNQTSVVNSPKFALLIMSIVYAMLCTSYLCGILSAINKDCPMQQVAKSSTTLTDRHCFSCVYHLSQHLLISSARGCWLLPISWKPS